MFVRMIHRGYSLSLLLLAVPLSSCIGTMNPATSQSADSVQVTLTSTPTLGSTSIPMVPTPTATATPSSRETETIEQFRIVAEVETGEIFDVEWAPDSSFFAVSHSFGNSDFVELIRSASGESIWKSPGIWTWDIAFARLCLVKRCKFRVLPRPLERTVLSRQWTGASLIGWTSATSCGSGSSSLSIDSLLK